MSSQGWEPYYDPSRRGPLIPQEPARRPTVPFDWPETRLERYKSVRLGDVPVGRFALASHCHHVVFPSDLSCQDCCIASVESGIKSRNRETFLVIDRTDSMTTLLPLKYLDELVSMKHVHGLTDAHAVVLLHYCNTERHWDFVPQEQKLLYYGTDWGSWACYPQKSLSIHASQQVLVFELVPETGLDQIYTGFAVRVFEAFSAMERLGRSRHKATTRKFWHEERKRRADDVLARHAADHEPRAIDMHTGHLTHPRPAQATPVPRAPASTTDEARIVHHTLQQPSQSDEHIMVRRTSSSAETRDMRIEQIVPANAPGSANRPPWVLPQKTPSFSKRTTRSGREH